MHPGLKSAARRGLRAVGLEDEARLAWAMRSRVGRRNVRDDRQLTFLLRATLSPTSNCIDVGAAGGDILREMVRMAPDGRHMAFEPNPDALRALERDFPQVELHGVALSDEAGEAEFHVAEMVQYSGLREREWLATEYRSITVPVARLDDVVPADRTVDFIKIDVEGAQVRVLRGAGRVLAKDRPAIWVEHGDRSAGVYDTTRADLWSILSEHEYRLFTADGDGPLSWEAFDSPAVKALWSFIAHR